MHSVKAALQLLQMCVYSRDDQFQLLSTDLLIY